jgi:hypothetical protein
MQESAISSLSRLKHLTTRDVDYVWRLSAEFDSTLAVSPKNVSALLSKRVVARSYSRAQLFEGWSDAPPVYSTI